MHICDVSDVIRRYTSRAPPYERTRGTRYWRTRQVQRLAAGVPGAAQALYLTPVVDHAEVGQPADRRTLMLSCSSWRLGALFVLEAKSIMFWAGCC